LEEIAVVFDTPPRTHAEESSIVDFPVLRSLLEESKSEPEHIEDSMFKP